MIFRTLKYYGRIVPYVRSHWRYVAAVALLTIILSLAAALQPWPLKILVDFALQGRDVPSVIVGLLAAFGFEPTPVTLIILAAAASLALFLLTSGLDAAITWGWMAGGQRMVYEFASDVFSKLQRLTPAFHTRNTVGDHLNRLTTDTYSLYTIVEALLVSPARNVLTIVTIGVLAWLLDPILTLIAFAVTPVLGAITVGMRHRIKTRSSRMREAQSDLMGFVHQTLNALPVVQAFGTEDENRQRFDRLADRAVATSQKSSLAQNVFLLMTGLTTTLAMALVLYAGGLRVLRDAISLGSLLVFIAYVKMLEGSFRGLFGIFADLKTAEAGLDRLYEILDSSEQVVEVPDAEPFRAHSEGIGIRFSAVSFGYESRTPALSNISLEIRPGETVVIAGRSGSGKSTLASLIPRFFDPWTGTVSFNGRDLRALKLSDVRAQVAMIQQEPLLMPLSIRDNIAFARSDASESEIRRAAEAAQVDEFAWDLPEGYDTIIGERGVSLSGGQRQRLAIARGFLKDAPILILDEPTSALDMETEQRLLDALERLMEGRTTIIIAHRFTMVRRASSIVVLDHGAVAERGTHAELMKARGSYYRLYSLQHAGDEEEVPT